MEVALYDKTVGVGKNDVQSNGLGSASLNTLVPCKDMVSLGVNALTKKIDKAPQLTHGSMPKPPVNS